MAQAQRTGDEGHDAAMAHILFVDDEPNVLSGLRRMLRDRRSEWQMVFVNSGEEALTAMAKTFFDVIVSDLRMPGMDGVDLLLETRRRSPETVRIALSGYADRDATMRAVSQIHQFLGKPCDESVLRRALQRAVSLGRFLQDGRLRQIVSSMATLPTLTTLFDEVVELLDSSETSAGQVGQKVAMDAGMSAKVLQLANSALFGLPQVVSSPVQATVLLGLDTMRLLILSIRIFDSFMDEGKSPVSEAEVWKHSILVARLAKRIALAELPEEREAEYAFLAGLFHDLGKLVLAVNLPEKYESVLRLSGNRPDRLCRVERSVIGATHGEVGAYLIGLWGFAESIIEAISLHHVPLQGMHTELGPLACLHIANALVHAAEDEDAPYDRFIDREYMAALDMEARLPLWHEMCQEVLTAENEP